MRIQGYDWDESVIINDETGEKEIKSDLSKEAFEALSVSYSEIGKKVQHALKEKESIEEYEDFDIKGYLVERTNDFIDYSFIESLFKIFVRAVRDKELEKIAQFKEEIHKSFHILSKEDQDIAIEILRDIENRASSLNEADTLMGLISNEKISAYERKVMEVAKGLGVENTAFCQKIMELSNKKLEELELMHNQDFRYITEELIDNLDVKRLFLEKRLNKKIEGYLINLTFRDFIEELIGCG